MDAMQNYCNAPPRCVNSATNHSLYFLQNRCSEYKEHMAKVRELGGHSFSVDRQGQSFFKETGFSCDDPLQP